MFLVGLSQVHDYNRLLDYGGKLKEKTKWKIKYSLNDSPESGDDAQQNWLDMKPRGRQQQESD